MKKSNIFLAVMLSLFLAVFAFADGDTHNPDRDGDTHNPDLTVSIVTVITSLIPIS